MTFSTLMHDLNKRMLCKLVFADGKANDPRILKECWLRDLTFVEERDHGVWEVNLNFHSLAEKLYG